MYQENIETPVASGKLRWIADEWACKFVIKRLQSNFNCSYYLLQQSEEAWAKGLIMPLTKPSL